MEMSQIYYRALIKVSLIFLSMDKKSYEKEIENIQTNTSRNLTTTPVTVKVRAQDISIKGESYDACTGKRKECTKPNERFLPSMSVELPISCYCDNQCALYGDCCNNWWDINNKTKASVLESYNNITEYSYCAHKEGRWMITECPDKAEKDLKVKCQTADEKEFSASTLMNVLWVESHTTKLSYRNIYCARCHNDAQNLTFINVKFYCRARGSNEPRESNYTLEEASQIVQTNKNCRLTRQEGIYDRICFSYDKENSKSAYIKTCPTESFQNKTLVRQCHHGKTEFTTWRNGRDNTAFVFKNEACVKCNWNATTTMSLVRDCFSLPKYSIQSNGRISFARLFDFSKLFADKGNKELCTENDIISQLILNISNDNKAICATNASNTTEAEGSGNEILGTIDTYVSIVSAILSVIGLVHLLIIYIKHPRLRNFQGLCVMSLSVSLVIVASLMTAAALEGVISKSVETSLLCQIRGFVLYYFYMNSLAWMFLICLQMFKTFTTTEHVNTKISTRKFILMSLCTHLPGFCATAILVVMDTVSTVPDALKPAIKASGCWFSSAWIILVFFYVPAFAVSAVAFGMFGVICGKLLKLKKQGEGLSAGSPSVSSSRIYLAIFKIALISGLPSSVSLLSQWLFKSPEVQRIVFIVASLLNGCQGLMISLSFVFTNQVKSVRKHQYSQKTTSSSLNTKL